MQYKDYYAILGVPRTADEAQIKQAYRKLARKYHPDVSQEPQAEERFKDVQEAYEILKDPSKRASYDQLGSNWRGGQDFQAPPGWQHGAAGFGGFEESFAGSGGDFSDFLAQMFGRTQRRTKRRSTANNTRKRATQLELPVTLEEAYYGGSKVLRLNVSSAGVTQQCELKVTIPKGVMPGQRIRLRGTKVPGGGTLLLIVQFIPHHLFTVQGQDVYLSLPITPWEAALGAKINLPTLGGTVAVSIAPGAQTGQKLRLNGRGLPLAQGEHGHQYVIMQIMNPPQLSAEQKQLYLNLQALSTFNPRTQWS